jgi:pimeloyl-ACP methyl ester carboxylesterase
MESGHGRSPDAPTLLLVHGGWSGAWMWQPLLRALDAQGPKVDVIDRLPSVGEDVSRLGGLHDDADAVRERLDAIGSPVVLCGHSYGGMVITEVADHPAIVHSIYLAALWPTSGQSVGDLLGGDLPNWIVDRGDGSLTVTDDLQRVHEVLFGDLDPSDAAWAHRQFLPQAASVFDAPSRAPARSHEATYILCTEDRAIPVAAQEAMSASADSILRLRSDHCPQLSHAEELERVLAGAVLARRRDLSKRSTQDDQGRDQGPLGRRRCQLWR